MSRVSVVVVNYRGADDTITCVRALADLDWPAADLEVVVVDNASGDDSVDRLRAALPDVVLVESPTNTGFAGGCNLGVERASGEYVAFVNSDARPDRAWLTAAVDALQDREVGAVACKVLDWDGTLVDYVDGSLTWYGMGYKREAGQPDSTAYDVAKDVLFATGSASVMRRDVFVEVGGFDERFFMFYEDVDLGWRLNLLGWRVRYVPESLVFHKHHASISKFGSYRETYLLERNALMALYKNLSDDLLAAALPAAMALAVRRGLARTETDATLLDLQRSPGGDADPDVTVPKMALTGAYAVDGFTAEIASLAESRADLQARRRRSDRALLPLFRQALEPALPIPSYLAAHDALVDAFGIEPLFRGRQRILVVTGEPLTERLAGPAIRAYEIARALAPEHDVRLVSMTRCEIAPEGFVALQAGGFDLRPQTDWADVVIFQGFLLEVAGWLKPSTKVVIADVYDPIHLEQLEQARDLGAVGRAVQVRETTRALNDQLARADFLLCASEKQRDFWLGQLAGQGRLNPLVYDEDASLSSLLAVVPFGTADEPPVQKRHAIRGAVPGIGPDDKVVLWGGGVYNWFDPLTLLHAVAALSERHPDLRLYFLGMKHPNPDVPEMQMAVETVRLAGELGLTDRVVFFNTDWVPYAERADYLLDADLGVSTHFHHVETAFSFRTRLLDYLWAGLPIVATGGDTFDPIIAAHRLGRTVPPEDVPALVEAIEDLLYGDPAELAATGERCSAYARTLTWSQVLKPLVDFCRDPRRAPDLAAEPLAPVEEPSRLRSSIRADLAIAKHYLRAGGVGEVARRAAGRLRRLRDS